MRNASDAEIVCQSCENHQYVERVEDDDPDEPYLLCPACAQRLRNYALRPLEWYNLASKHGWRKYLLQSDFYDQDGTASQPETEHYATNGLLMPSLHDVARSPERLFSFCVAQWHLDEPIYDALRSLPSDALFSTLKQRSAAGNTHVHNVALRIAARVFGPSAADWVRGQYERSCANDSLLSWSEAAASCLLPEDGLAKTLEALAQYNTRQLPNKMGALSWFRSPLVLNWIEANAPQANVQGSWGQLAALSSLTWEQAEDWLSRGRPLSLITLDALGQFIPRPGHAPLVRELRPKLLDAPDPATIIEALQAQMLADPAPRIVKGCEYLIEHVEELCGQDQT